MAFVNLSVLAGGLFISIPIALHLLLRQQPKLMSFPALRFLQQKRDANQRRLKLRHLLLLLFRCLAILAIALAMARPSVGAALLANWGLIALLIFSAVVIAIVGVAVYAQRRSLAWLASSGTVSVVMLLVAIWMIITALQASAGEAPIGNERAPVAAMFVFDSSPRLDYQHQSKTRLDQAKEIATNILKQLPPESDIGIIDSRTRRAAFSAALGAAQGQINKLDTTGAPRRLSELIKEALVLAKSSLKARREIFLFSDLTVAAWEGDDWQSLREELAKAKEVSLYIIDVGVEDPLNVSISDLRLSKQTVNKNAELQIELDVERLGPDDSRTVELYLEEPDLSLPVVENGKIKLPRRRLRGQKLVQLTKNGKATVQFTLRELELGTHQGMATVIGKDGLEIDDQRFFAVEVNEAWPVLVVNGDDASSRFFVDSIAPPSFRQSGRARFVCKEIPQGDLANEELSSYTAVCLLDPMPITPELWKKLAEFVEGGGGLAIALGHNAQADAFNNAAAQQVMPGKLSLQWRTGADDVSLQPELFRHAILKVFRDRSSSIPWHQSPVFRLWDTTEMSTDAVVVLRFNNGRAALIESTMGRGRVLLMTTPLSDKPRPKDRRPWNELAFGEDNWPPFVLINEMMTYLSQSGDRKLNYVAGNRVILPNAELDPPRYQMFPPSGDPVSVIARSGRVSIRFTERPGAYRLRGNRGGDVVRGFAVNLPPSLTRLERIQSGRLDEFLGADRYVLSKDQNDIEVGVGNTRRGREFYPYLILALAVVFGLEQFLSNRFYKPTSESSSS